MTNQNYLNATLDRLKTAPPNERAAIMASLPKLLASQPVEAVQSKPKALQQGEREQLDQLRAMMKTPEARENPLLMSKLATACKRVRGY